MKILYSVSARHYCTFGALLSEQLSYKIKELDRVGLILPDSYLDIKNKDYGGKPFINGQAVSYDPKYNEEWASRPNERNFDRSRNFERREMEIIRRPTVRPSNIGGHTCRPSNMGVHPNSKASHAGGAPNMGATSTTVSVQPYNTSSFQNRDGLHPNKMSSTPNMVAMPLDNNNCPPNTGTMAPNYMSGKISSGVQLPTFLPMKGYMTLTGDAFLRQLFLLFHILSFDPTVFNTASRTGKN